MFRKLGAQLYSKAQIPRDWGSRERAEGVLYLPHGVGGWNPRESTADHLRDHRVAPLGPSNLKGHKKLMFFIKSCVPEFSHPKRLTHSKVVPGAESLSARLCSQLTVHHRRFWNFFLRRREKVPHAVPHFDELLSDLFTMHKVSALFCLVLLCSAGDGAEGPIHVGQSCIIAVQRSQPRILFSVWFGVNAITSTKHNVELCY